MSEEETRGAVGGGAKDEVDLQGASATERRRLRRRNCVRSRGGASTGRRGSQGCGAGSEGPPTGAGAEGVRETEGGEERRKAEPELTAFAHHHDDTSEGAVHYFQDENGELSGFRAFHFDRDTAALIEKMREREMRHRTYTAVLRG